MIKFLLVLLCFAAGPLASASFKETNQRYISGYDFQNRMGYFFDEVYKDPSSNSVVSSCFGNSTAFGANIPALGSPMNALPNSDTVKVLTNCARSTVNQLLMNLMAGTYSFEQTRVILGRIMPKHIVDSKLTPENVKSFFNTYNLLTDAELKETVAFLVTEFLGTDENILSYGLITDVSKYQDYLNGKVTSSMSLSTIYSFLIPELILRDEFLTY